MHPTRDPDNDSRPKGAKSLVEFVAILVVAFVLVFGFVRPVVAATFSIPSESMVPNLEVGDRVLANKLAYDLSDVRRGDIVVFESPESGEVLIKRAIGLPGDTLEIRQGSLYLNDERQEEDYLDGNTRRQAPFGPTTVPEDHFFAMGDNRSSSYDSRYYGPVPEENLIGEALVRYWPPGRVGVP
ncbi:MAG: signal peptidase I [Rubrobacteraceae bacterium]